MAKKRSRKGVLSGDMLLLQKKIIIAYVWVIKEVISAFCFFCMLQLPRRIVCYFLKAVGPYCDNPEKTGNKEVCVRIIRGGGKSGV